jgi:epoxyqueuosine reductase
MNKATTEFLDLVNARATEAGLFFIGAADFDVSSDFTRFEAWLDEGRHGQMSWLENHKPVRANPALLRPGTQNALIFGLEYNLGDRWLRGDLRATPKIAQYARLRDYHKALKDRLEGITATLVSSRLIGGETRCAVDSAPLLERALAAKTGAVFIGKNTCAIHPKRGSFFLIGSILVRFAEGVSIPSAPPIPQDIRGESGGCGTCKRCQVHCPTNALNQDYVIDARRCLSYWTIEHRGEIPEEFWPWIGRYVFGCDICQLVCPYNRDLTVSATAKSLTTQVGQTDLIDVVGMTQGDYERMFGGTPMTRAKRDGLRRNAIIALAVRGDSRLKPLLENLHTDPNPVIRATAVAALKILV